MKSFRTSFIVLLLTVLSFSLLIFQKTSAACAANTANLGQATGTFTVATTGTYRVWSRLQPDSTNVANNSYTLEVDSGTVAAGSATCNITVGDATIPANTWSWVDYRDGGTSNKINMALTAGTHTITMYGRESGVKLDRVVFSLDPACLPTGNGDNCATSTLPPPDTTPPVATVSSPANGATVSSTVTINASATDNVGVTKIEIYVDGILKTSSATSPATFALDTTTLTNATHTIVAKAYDAANNPPGIATVSVTVNNAPPTDTTPPTNVVITSPAAGTTISGTNTTIQSSASDNVGVTKVEFYMDNVLLGTDTLAPFSFGLNTTLYPNGSHVLISKAYDAANNNTTSAAVTVTINNLPPPDTTPPVATIKSPANGATVSSTVTINATATDNVGVTKIEIYVDGILKTSSATSPATFALDTTTLTNATHTIVAKAYDAANNPPGIATVSVTVNNTTPAPTNVAITSPAPNATISGTNTLIQSTASDTVGITKVEFYMDNVLLGTDTLAPFTFGLDTTLYPNGSHVLISKAYNANSYTTSAAVTVTINNLPPPDTTPPTITLSPSTLNGTTVTGTISLNAKAFDNVGVTKVEFYVDTLLKSTSLLSPYTYSVDTTSLTNASHSLYAMAYDAAGHQTPTPLQTFTVNNTIVPPVSTKPGDADGDGFVTLTDLSILSTHYGQTVSPNTYGDFNNDSKVNLSDLSILSTNYGK